MNDDENADVHRVESGGRRADIHLCSMLGLLCKLSSDQVKLLGCAMSMLSCRIQLGLQHLPKLPTQMRFMECTFSHFGNRWPRKQYQV